MEKNTNTQSKNTNLLQNAEFKEQLQFEADYASILKGGHYPYYFDESKQERLVTDVNLLTPKEQQDLVFNLFISRN
jgi:hypothetical protein